jgi:2,3-bisphosphoglycerate-dependent phosphoglycerate mutase
MLVLAALELCEKLTHCRAGSRDSPLTIHGFEQAKRLATYLKISGVDLTHIFCSPLQRALITAEQIRDGQTSEAQRDVVFIPIPALQEQDFGLFEGISTRDYRAGDSRYSSVESLESMSSRADAFIDEYLSPLFSDHTTSTIGIISHGCMLRVLWNQLLAKVSPKMLTCDQGMLSTSGSIDARNIVMWSNTGFLEVKFVRNLEPSTNSKDGDAAYHANVITINGRPHLDGFKKIRGGVGNGQYDARQTTLGEYFTTNSAS